MTTTAKKSHSTWLIVLAIGVIVVMSSIVLTVMVRAHIVNIANQNSPAINNEIQARAIEQKDPALCTQISGSTSVSFPLPTPDNGVQNTTRTFDQAESIARCQTQAKAGTPFVY